MSYFSPAKSERTATKPLTAAAPEPRTDTAAAASKAQEMVSTIGSGMLITGNIVSTGAVQIFGRVVGDIHAARLIVCDGAQVEGKVMAQEAIIDGVFKGTIHANSVKLQATAKVDGEVYNKSLTIEQDAQFEGVARRLDRAVDAPTAAQTKPEAPVAAPLAPTYAAQAPVAEAIPLSSGQNYSANSNDRPGWTS